MSNNSNLCPLEDQVLCPICLEVFCNPVTTACGHNFCMTCLQGFWDHQATTGETFYCPQCRQSFPSRPHLCKNVVLEEMVTCFTQAKGQTFGSSCNLARPRDVPCDFCSPQKLKSVKSCLECAASLCEKHLRSHFEDQVFQDHQLLEPVRDLKSCLCQRHRKLRRLYCRTEGCCVCSTCLLEEHENHDAIPLQEERACKEVGRGAEPGTCASQSFSEGESLWLAPGTPFLEGKFCSHSKDAKAPSCGRKPKVITVRGRELSPKIGESQGVRDQG